MCLSGVAPSGGDLVAAGLVIERPAHPLARSERIGRQVIFLIAFLLAPTTIFGPLRGSLISPCTHRNTHN